MTSFINLEPDALASDLQRLGPIPWRTGRANGANGQGRDTPLIGRASDLQVMKFPPVRYVVPGFIAEGCTLLAGRPKLGKSWLMLDVGLAVAGGRYCLGDARCEQGGVLYLALEDNQRRLQRRIDKVLGAFAEEWPAAFEYATEWPRSNEGGVETIRDWIIAAKNPRLVVVDVLAMFKPARGDRETLYEADYNSLKELQAVASEFGIGIVAIHHTRKSGSDSGDPVEKISGSLGLSGAADAFLILDRDGQGTSLAGRGRDVEEIETAVKFDKDTCRWTVMGEASEVRRSDERSSIVTALCDSPEPMSPREVSDAAGLPYTNVRQLLVRMHKAGEVEVKRGLYRLSNTPVTTVTMSQTGVAMTSRCDVVTDVTGGLEGAPRVLVPFDRREALSLRQAAEISGKSVETVRRWCSLHDIGRPIGGQWAVSHPALLMMLDGDRRALSAYLAGERHAHLVRLYFDRAGCAQGRPAATDTSQPHVVSCAGTRFSSVS